VSQAAPTRVLIVDDRRVVVEGLRALLSERPGLEVVGTASSVASAVSSARSNRPDVVLMDFRLPDGTGAVAAKAIRAEQPLVAVVILSADDSEESLLAAVEAGACGYLVKTDSVSDVADAIRRAADGEILVPPSLLVRLVTSHRQRALDRSRKERLLGELTHREIEILRLMTEGLDNQSISERLLISYTTVRAHVRNILGKLDAHSKLEAVARASEYGLLG
jgi:DNA-binding NarL/FixJ family response regulator